MPLSKVIQQKIATLSSQNKQDEIVVYLKAELEKGSIAPQDVYDYVKNTTSRHKKGNPYEVDAATINQIGVCISKILKDDNENMSAQFYFLAADRGSAWGYRNYADVRLSGKYGTKVCIKTGLEYAKKAVDNTPKTSPHQHKYMYAKALKANNFLELAFTNITDYLPFVLTQKKQEQNIKYAVKLCDQLIDELLANVLEGDFDYSLAHEHFQTPLSSLNTIISCPSNRQELHLIRNKASFLAGKYHEFLKEDSKAWLVYCKANDKGAPFYEKLINARKTLLKAYITKKIDDLIVSAIDIESLALNNDAQKALARPRNTKDTILLPNKIPLSLNFSEFWTKDSTQFHSINEKGLEKRYKKRIGQIMLMIDAKQAEITLIEKALIQPEEVATKKIVLETELRELQQVAEEINNYYQQNRADNRKTIRRHQGEIRFFDPTHLKKQAVLETLKDLTFGIIEQRFSLAKTALLPLSLVGVSSRMLITAERVFQEAAITLSGESGVILGIPRHREKDWSINGYSGTHRYGPREHYKVADTEIYVEHRTSPKRQRLGDSFMPLHGAYSNDIYPFFKLLSASNPDNEKLIAQYLIRYSKTHQPITLEELQLFYPDAAEKDVNQFNQIAFLIMEKEQAQWHSATDKRYQLGMSVSQARVLKMLEAGHLRFDEVFKNNVMFGVYSQTGIINSPAEVMDACKRIDELYGSFVTIQYPNESMRFFKSQIKDKESRTLILTRKQARQDLQYVYGGETDSDGDGYDTDVEILSL